MTANDLFCLICYVAAIICLWEAGRKLFVGPRTTSNAASILAKRGASLRRARTQADRDTLHTALAKACGKTWGKG